MFDVRSDWLGGTAGWWEAGQAGTALAGWRLARDAPDIFSGHVQQVRGDGHVAAVEHEPGTLDPVVDQVRVPGGVLRDSPVDDLGLCRVGERGQVADALFRLPARSSASGGSRPRHGIRRAAPGGDRSYSAAAGISSHTWPSSSRQSALAPRRRPTA